MRNGMVSAAGGRARRPLQLSPVRQQTIDAVRDGDVGGVGPQVVIVDQTWVQIPACARIAEVANHNGFLAPELAAGIARAKGVKRLGVRLGQWLSSADAQKLLALPDPASLKGIRDRAILSLLQCAGLRPPELASLDFSQIQPREGRWLLVDLHGKQGRM